MWVLAESKRATAPRFSGSLSSVRRHALWQVIGVELAEPQVLPSHGDPPSSGVTKAARREGFSLGPRAVWASETKVIPQDGRQTQICLSGHTAYGCNDGDAPESNEVGESFRGDSFIGLARGRAPPGEEERDRAGALPRVDGPASDNSRDALVPGGISRRVVDVRCQCVSFPLEGRHSQPSQGCRLRVPRRAFRRQKPAHMVFSTH